MPRRIAERIYYRESKALLVRPWSYRVFLRCLGTKDRFKDGPKKHLFKVPLYARALAYERERLNNDFERELRKSSSENLLKNSRFTSRFLCGFEALQLSDRERASAKIYADKLRQSKDGQ